MIVATIREVADRAGVSVATVSRYLNKSGYVGKKSQVKIQQAIEETQYVPNEIARSLNQKASKILGLILPDITNPYFTLLAKGAEDYAQAQGYMVIIGNSEDDQRKVDQYVAFFRQYNVSGIMTASELFATAASESIPVVALDRFSLGQDDQYAVVTDDFKGGTLIAEAILATTFERIVILKGPDQLTNASQRLAGILAGFAAAGRAVDYRIIETGSYHFADAERTAKTLLDEYLPFDTVIASNDLYAMAIMSEAISRGHQVPADIQIIGYDGIPFGQLLQPKLATIEQPAYQIGGQACALLLDILHKRAIKQKIIKLTPKLLAGNTLRKK